LMWQKSGSPDSMKYKNAQAYVENLNREGFAGHSNWRLPTVDELMSLLTPKEMNGNLYIDPIFDKTQWWCWTSDQRASDWVWIVNFGGGFVSGLGFIDGYYIRAVRSLSDQNAKEALKQAEEAKQKQIEAERERLAQKSKYKLRKTPITASYEDFKSKFILDEERRPLEYVKNEFKDNGDGTIADSATDLLWQKSGSPDQMNHENAKAYFANLNLDGFAGHKDWRLPTVDELKSLLTPKEMNGKFYIDPIFDKTQRWCWTSDKYASGGAWYVNFFIGYVDWNYHDNSYVRAVRSLSDQKVKEALKQAQEEERKRLESEQKVKEELKQVEEAKQKQIEAEHERLAQEEERKRMESDQKAKEALKQAQEAKDRADKEERDARRIAQEEERQRAENKAERDARQIAQKEERQRAEKERKKYKPEFTNKLGMKFVYIPSGSFMMGMDKDSYEKQHKVTLTKGFYMQTIEVTQGQWKVIMGSNPSKFNDCGDNCPVEQVSWNNVQEFIKKLNRKEGTDKYRLPTEAEWEYAARAGTTTAYNWGSSADCSKANYGNYRSSYNMFSDSNISECEDKNPGKTMKVGSFDPNAFGLYDMAGNVSEWVQDIYKNVIYMSDQTDPIYTGSVPDPFRVIRGGGWGSKAQDCQSAYRNGSRRPDYRDDLVGFRLVRSQ